MQSVTAAVSRPVQGSALACSRVVDRPPCACSGKGEQDRQMWADGVSDDPSDRPALWCPDHVQNPVFSPRDLPHPPIPQPTNLHLPDLSGSSPKPPGLRPLRSHMTAAGPNKPEVPLAAPLPEGATARNYPQPTKMAPKVPCCDRYMQALERKRSWTIQCNIRHMAGGSVENHGKLTQEAEIRNAHLSN